jgi:hypothetical protein
MDHHLNKYLQGRLYFLCGSVCTGYGSTHEGKITGYFRYKSTSKKRSSRYASQTGTVGNGEIRSNSSYIRKNYKKQVTAKTPEILRKFVIINTVLAEYIPVR